MVTSAALAEQTLKRILSTAVPRIAELSAQRKYMSQISPHRESAAAFLTGTRLVILAFALQHVRANGKNRFRIGLDSFLRCSPVLCLTCGTKPPYADAKTWAALGLRLTELVAAAQHYYPETVVQSVYHLQICTFSSERRLFQPINRNPKLVHYTIYNCKVD